jgi:FkbM family methyltransferase
MDRRTLRILEPFTRRRVRHLGTTIYTDLPAFSAYKRAELFWNIYERTECVYIKQYLAGSDLVIELGAGLGVSSAHIATGLAGGAQLLCVEANPALLSSLERNVAAHVQRHGVHSKVVNAAVGRDGQRSVLDVHGDPLVSRVSEAADAGAEVVAIRARSLNSLVQEIGARPYDLVCDIEGAEAHFIVGEDRSGLRLCRRLIIELHSCTVAQTAYAPDDLLSALRERWGFNLLARKGPIVALARN